MSRLAWLLRVALVLLVAAFIGLLAIARGRGGVDPRVLAAVAGVACAVAAAAAATAILRALAEPRWIARASEGLLTVGLLVASGAGLANWAFGVSGVVVLTEGETVNLRGGDQVADLVAGPLARTSDLDGRLKLAKVELLPAGDGTFIAESTLMLAQDGRQVSVLRATSLEGASVGPFHLFQGAFGFAPQIVLLKEGRTVFDGTVPFLSRRDGPRGVSFEGDVRIQEEDVTIVAAMDLRELDERMKGHPTLAVEVRRGAEVLGAGRLQPGHGASIRDGWRVGFGNLRMWSEIDIVRKSHRTIVLGGLALALAAAVAWMIASWARR